MPFRNYNLIFTPISQTNLELFKADSSTDIWKAYVDYIDEMVVDGFFNTIRCSLQYMLHNTGE